jgi:xanthine/CO dehydrogenase XdhC/CoxF family maturation factor
MAARASAQIAGVDGCKAGWIAVILQPDSPARADLVIDSEGNFLGSVSGGCVEGDVITEALDVIALGGQNILEFGVVPSSGGRGESLGGRCRRCRGR